MRLFFATILACSFVFLYAQNADTTDTKPLEFAAVEFVPVAEGCDSLIGTDELRKCFSEKITKHFNENIIYTKAAIKRNIEAKIYVGFTIEKDGSIGNVKLLRGAAQAKDYDYLSDLEAAQELDMAALRVMKSFKVSKPAYKNGIPIEMDFAMAFNAKPN